MEHRSQEHDPPEDDDRIRSERFVDILKNVEMPTDHLCVGNVIYDKHVKLNVVT